jgi:hypothetical protein
LSPINAPQADADGRQDRYVKDRVKGLFELLRTRRFQRDITKIQDASRALHAFPNQSVGARGGQRNAFPPSPF